MITVFRWPIMSARRPPNANVEASARRYAFTTHCTPLTLRFSSDWILGTAIDTIVWSM